MSPVSKNTAIKTVLFDMDGTLVDNFTALHKAFAHAHEQLGLEPPTYEKVIKTVGGSAPITMARLMGEKNASRAMPHFDRYFEEHMLEGACTLPGALWLLDCLRTRGYSLAIFTNKTGEIARRMCAYLELENRLDAVIGAGDTPWRKPQPEFTAHALEQMNARAEETAMIGDSPFDLQAAQAGGLTAWMVATGSHTVAELEACKPPADAVFENLHRLGEHCFGLSPEVA